MRNSLFIFLILCNIYQLMAGDYLDPDKVTFDPDHKNINLKGSLEITFDLNDRDTVDQVYVQVKIGSEFHTLPSSVMDSDFSSSDNKITIKGIDLAALIEDNNSVQTRSLYMEEYLFTDGEQESDIDVEVSDIDVQVDDDFDNPDDKETVDTDYIENDLEEQADVDLIQDNENTDIDENDTETTSDKTYSCELVVEGTTTDTEEPDEDADTDADTSSTSTTTKNSYEDKKSFEIKFDNVAPATPKEVATDGGNNKIYLTVTPSLEDENGTSGEKIGKYYIVVSGIFEKDGEEVEHELTIKKSVEEAYRDKAYSFSFEGTEGYTLINNDAEDGRYVYDLEIYAEDLAGNKNPENYIETTGQAITTEGFWRRYKNNGGKEDGGFCFIATASYGSYFHPHVKILRTFRDKILLTNSFGKSLVNIYYTYSPKGAELIETYPLLKPVVRVFLLPFVVFSYIVLNPLILSLFLLFFVGLFFIYSKRKSAAATICLLCMFSFSLKAEDMKGDLTFSNSYYNPQQIDDSATGTPFGDIAKEKYRYLPIIMVGVEIPIWDKIKLTGRIGGGFTRLKGTSIKADGTLSKDKTYFHMMPMNLEVRLLPVYDFGLKPYIAGGLDYNFWWVNEDSEAIEAGGTYGFHFLGGIELSLNWMDPSAAIKMRESFGIEDSALFVHYRVEKIDDFGSDTSWNLSFNRFEAGLLFHF